MQFCYEIVTGEDAVNAKYTFTSRKKSISLYEILLFSIAIIFFT